LFGHQDFELLERYYIDIPRLFEWLLDNLPFQIKQIVSVANQNMRTAKLGVIASLGLGVFAQGGDWDIKPQPWSNSQGSGWGIKRQPWSSSSSQQWVRDVT